VQVQLLELVQEPVLVLGLLLEQALGLERP
jgi:hypothetical protein